MASDWIKMRTDLYRDPKVCIIADYMARDSGELARYVNQNKQCDMCVTSNVTRNATVGALVAVWGVLRHRGKRHNSNLNVPFCTLDVIDDISDMPGLGSAMAAVGWVIENEKGLVLPNFFDEFNVEPEAAKKEKNAERQRRYRKSHNALRNAHSNALRNVTVTSQSNAREEKSREEESIRELSKDNSLGVSKRKFTPPTIDEVHAYCLERQNAVPVETFMAHYESNGWKVGKNPMRDWRAAVRTWEKNHPKPASRLPTPEEDARWNPYAPDGGLGYVSER